MPSSLPSTYKAAVFEKAGSPLVIKKDMPMRKPGKGEVLVKVLACGVCHTDSFIGKGAMGDLFPRVPGHEIIGDVAAVGEGCTRFEGGERVGGSWHGGHDGTCRSCQRGDFQMCEQESNNGVSFDGGYAEYTILREEAVVRVPSDMDPVQAAPLLCAGVTVYNGMRNMDVRPGRVVAIQGLGGLGHLAVQYAARMGYEVVAISSGGKKKDFAKKLGAHHYIDTSSQDAAKELQKLGGADMIVATAPNPDAISPLVGGLGPKGKLVCLAPVGDVKVDSVHLITKGASLHGWPAGSQFDAEETIAFSKLTGVECMIEKFSLDDAQKALEHMERGEVRFRGVLVMQ